MVQWAARCLSNKKYAILLPFDEKTYGEFPHIDDKMLSKGKIVMPTHVHTNLVSGPSISGLTVNGFYWTPVGLDKTWVDMTKVKET